MTNETTLSCAYCGHKSFHITKKYGYLYLECGSCSRDWKVEFTGDWHITETYPVEADEFEDSY